jgi:hypothetical protein
MRSIGTNLSCMYIPGEGPKESGMRQAGLRYPGTLMTVGNKGFARSHSCKEAAWLLQHPALKV